MEKSLVGSFSALYQKMNSDGSLAPFFQQPDALEVASNDFAADMLLLEKSVPGLSDQTAAQIRAAVSVCRQAVDENVEPLADDRLEGDLILHLVAAISARG